MPHCKWFEPSTELEEYMKPRSRYPKEVECIDDIEEIFIEYVQCVPLDVIKDPDIWAPRKMERLMKWANRETLNTILMKDHEIDITKVPLVERLHEWSENAPKFDIIDGNHRIAVAKELRLDCILTRVFETIRVKK